LVLETKTHVRVPLQKERLKWWVEILGPNVEQTVGYVREVLLRK